MPSDSDDKALATILADLGKTACALDYIQVANKKYQDNYSLMKHLIALITDGYKGAVLIDSDPPAIRAFLSV
ncbi:hypothetical protein [Candidatus Doolittlea endobia]|uniref:hypothetical protein n=1 Tax=Candidatus Doolittlea endobia TaxID=1778262 RepID=UPI0013151E0E|nr:hypothetical protein [Candidatus Doolittlea endobia]